MSLKEDGFKKSVRLFKKLNIFAKSDFEIDFAQGWAFLQKSCFLTFPALHISFWTFEIQKNVGLSKDFCMILTIFDSFIYVLSFCLNYLLARDYVDINNKLIFLHVFEEYLMLLFQKDTIVISSKKSIWHKIFKWSTSCSYENSSKSIWTMELSSIMKKFSKSLLF